MLKLFYFAFLRLCHSSSSFACIFSHVKILNIIVSVSFLSLPVKQIAFHQVDTVLNLVSQILFELLHGIWLLVN